VENGLYTALILSLHRLSDHQAHVAAARNAGYCELAKLPGGLIWKSYVRESDAMVLFTRCADRAAISED
jgi:hypothetical protein